MKYSAVIINNGYLEDVYASQGAARMRAFILQTESRDPVCSNYFCRVVTGVENIRRATNYQYSVEEIKRRCWQN